MALGLILSLVDAITNGPEGDKPASLTMAGIDPSDPLKIYRNGDFDFSERAIQYWPETITDSIDVGWNFKDVPGASHALAQWASNNGRTITFDVQLSRLMIPVDSRTVKEKILSSGTAPDWQDPKDNRKHNVDIKEQVKWLRGFCYPTYLNIEGVVSALPPPIMILDIPKFGLNESGGDTIYCIMTSCDVVYTLAFRDGTPRRATVSLTLRQIVQTANGVQFKGFGQDAPAKYKMVIKGEMDNPSAGRPSNAIDLSKVK